jgi:hypothetical protein
MQPLLPSTQTGYFDSLEILLRADDFITTDKFLNFTLEEPKIFYSKRDYLFKSGEFRGEFVESVLKKRTEIFGKILILGHSDISTNIRHLLFLKNLGLKNVLGTNTRVMKGFSSSLPLGLTNSTSESVLHPIFGNIKHFEEANTSEYCSDFFPKVLANFSVQNNFRLRKNLINNLLSFSNFYDVAIETPEMNSAGRIAYLRKLREFPLVVCPEGNGADTHRLWETLYMGGVPIVVNNPLLNSLFDMLPVIRLDNWGQLNNLDYIENAWHSARTVSWNPNYLSFTYWKTQIKKLSP